MSASLRFAFLLVLLPSVVLADDQVQITPDVVYGHKFGMALTFDVFRPKSNANGAGVLFMVSGGWYSRWRPPEQAIGLFRPLLDKGFTVFAVRHGSSPKFTVPEAVADVRRSVRYIRSKAAQFDIDADRLGVFGGSAGGHLSLVLGTTGGDGNPNSKDPLLKVSDRVAAVVAYYPPTDLAPWTNPESSYYKNYPALRFETKLAASVSPRFHVSPDDPPTLLVHGDKDKLVPLDHSEKILVQYQKHKVPARLLVIEGAAHGFRGPDRQRATDALVEWFSKHLAKQQ